MKDLNLWKLQSKYNKYNKFTSKVSLIIYLKSKKKKNPTKISSWATAFSFIYIWFTQFY